jgi:hypothetical protein
VARHLGLGDAEGLTSTSCTSLRAGCCYYRSPVGHGKGGLMLWTIVVILLILWLVGALGAVSLPVLSGNTVHLLLVIVIIIVVIQLLQGRRR